MENNKFYNILLKKGKILHKKYIKKYIANGKDKIKIYTHKHKTKYGIECRPNKVSIGYYSCDKCKQILEACRQLESERKFKNTSLALGHYSYKNGSILPQTFSEKRKNRTMVTSVYLIIDCHGEVENYYF